MTERILFWIVVALTTLDWAFVLGVFAAGAFGRDMDSDYTAGLLFFGIVGAFVVAVGAHL